MIKGHKGSLNALTLGLDEFVIVPLSDDYNFKLWD